MSAMLFAASITREQFVGWLGRTFDPSPRRIQPHEISEPTRDRIMLFWENLPKRTGVGTANPIIGVPERDLQEFFAFVGVYVSTFQPFSAFFRVAQLEQLESLLDGAAGEPQRTVPAHLIGVIMAEARAQIGGRVRTPSDLSIQGCLATASSAAASALAVGFGEQHLDRVLENWTRARRRLTDEPLRLSAELVREFWTVVGGLDADRPISHRWSGRWSDDGSLRRIAQFVSEVMLLTDEADPETWGLLTEHLPRSRTALQRMREAREDRVRALDEMLPEIVSLDTVDRRIREVVGGYLMSRVAGGSVRYFQLLQPFEAQLPLVSMWFGFFCARRSDSDAMTVGECLGRRLARHIMRPHQLFDPPDCDISVDELEVVLPDSQSDVKFRTEHNGVVSIEIFPMINAVFRQPKELRREVSTRGTGAPHRAVSEIRYLVGRLSRAVDELADPGQRGLFDDEYRREPIRPRSKKTEK